MISRLFLLLLLLSACSTFAADLLKPDIVVDDDGIADFNTIQAAVQSVPRTNRERIIILVKDGIYREKIRVDASFITLRGESRKGTRIEFAQVKDDFVAQPDGLGWGVINLNWANDFVLENLTVENTATDMSAHAFAISGTGDRTITMDCDLISRGGDTVALGRGEAGHFYHARCNFSGSVDFVCPRGWCYARDCSFYAHRKTAVVWHHGALDPKMKFVLRNCRFDGATGFVLGRHHVDAQFYFLDCTFSSKMKNHPIHRVLYPLEGGPPTEGDARRNADLDKQNIWGERSYFHNCDRDGRDFSWFADNFSSALDSPTPSQITAAWAFDGEWDPEDEHGPTIKHLRATDRRIALRFSEPVTVKGKPRLKMCHSGSAEYVAGSGGDTLVFQPPPDSSNVCSVDLNGGAIIACQASATLRMANISIPRGEENTEGGLSLSTPRTFLIRPEF
jgi:pectinesterase